MNKEEYDKLERPQKLHRAFNSTIGVIILVIGYFFLKAQLEPLYEDISGLTEQRIEQQEISQIYADESLRLCQYKDSLGNATIGVGHLVLERENLPECITTHQAMDLLVKDYRYAKSSVEMRYPWAKGEVKLILINMSFQLGENRLSKFTQTLGYLKEGNYHKAAGEVLDSVIYQQAPNRIQRHSARMLSLIEEY